jgi:hypothetical protein
MPLYFFHVRGGHAPAEAEEGWTLGNSSAALQSATTAARSLIASDVLDGILDLTARIVVEDSDGRSVVTVPFASVVTEPERARHIPHPSRPA